MGFFDKIKSIFSQGPSIEELEEIPILNEKWIASRFEFPFPDSTFLQLKKISSKEFPTRNEVIMGFILPNLGDMVDIKRLACFVDKRTNPPTVLLRFPDRTEGDEEMIGKIVYKDTEKSEDEYRFTPIEEVKYQENMQAIEEALLTVFGLQKIQTRDMMSFYFGEKDEKDFCPGIKPSRINSLQNEEIEEKDRTKKKDEKYLEEELKNKDPLVMRTDNITYFCYPFEKRVKMFSEQRKAEEWLTENLFGESFNELIDFVMEKENYNPVMEKYCSEVREILDRYDMEF